MRIFAYPWSKRSTLAGLIWLSLPFPACPGAPGAPASSHWAWQPLHRPTVPRIDRGDWAKEPLDYFVLARLDALGLSPAPEASREQLLRRLSLDLTGLPPEPRQLDASLADSSPDSWERAVDQLLASPAYGERWGRHWLDLARFAESNGFEHDEARPDAWRYRDYVIRSFNADKPYDRFIEEQIAGDELFPGSAEARIATGFNLLGPDMTDASDQSERRHNTLCDMTDTTGYVFLGASIACARCHDHKFEPLLQADYYRLQAFFAPAQFRMDLAIATAEQRAAFDRATGELGLLSKPIENRIEELEAPYRARLRETKLEKVADEAREAHRTREDQRTARQRELVTATERLISVSPDEIRKSMADADRTRRDGLAAELKRLEPLRPAALPVAMGLSTPAGRALPTRILDRGDLRQPLDEVTPGAPAALAATFEASVDTSSEAAGRRTALARWIASEKNPLTARVIANRVWQHHFGRGLVASPSDFGVRGDRPTHPELLDWLASELIAHDWSLKALHRTILRSAAYRQSSLPSADGMAKDPENRLLSHQNRVRLEAEAVRDSLLAASGLLDRRAGGPGDVAPGSARRSIYLFARRNLRAPFLEAFDLPDSNATCPRRERSTTPTQALSLLNSEESMRASRALARRLEADVATLEARVLLAYRIVLSRRPTDSELALARDFLAASPLSELCRALLNASESVWVD